MGANASDDLQRNPAELRAKIGELDANRDDWRREAWWRREAAGVPKTLEPLPTREHLPGWSGPRPLTDVRADPNFTVAGLGGEASGWLELVERMVSDVATEPLRLRSELRIHDRGYPNNAAVSCEEGDVGRSLAWYVLSLEFCARMWGAPWALLESVRLFDVLHANMEPMTRTIRGERLALLELRPQFIGSRSQPLSSGWDNDKEKALGDGAYTDLVFQMHQNLGRQPQLTDRVETGLRRLDLLERKWTLLKGGDPEWLFPRDRVIHPFIRYVMYLHLRFLMEENAERKENYRTLRDRALGQLEAEMFFYDDGDGESVAWCYNVLAATSDSDNADPYQPSCYIQHNQVLMLRLGMMGLGLFATRRFQEALARTMWTSLLMGGPFAFNGKDGDKRISGTAFCASDIAPARNRWLDTRKPRPPSRLFVNDQQERQMFSNDAAEHYRSAGSVQHFGMGAGMMFAPAVLADYAQQHICGTAAKPTVRGHLVTFPVGFALRAAYQDSGRTDFK